MIRVLIYIMLFISTSVFSQNLNEVALAIPSDNIILNGTLLTPQSENKVPLVIIIAGSGPTDRNGNSAATKNNSLKFLAENLAKNNIASFRYDKSVISLKKEDSIKVNSLRFENFINEAKTVINYFKNKNNYSKIIVAGHSQGSLVGIIACKNSVDGFISLAGAGRPIDEVLAEQIQQQAPFLMEETNRVLTELKKGNTVEDINPFLTSIFNKSVQPFLISWIKYNPQTEIEKLNIPILIINGSKDLQVKNIDAELLHKASKNSQLEIIENMNHLFKEIKGDKNENMKSYGNPDLPIMTDFSNIITTFVNDIK